MQPAKQILPIIILSQFCCTSLWFAGNAVVAELIRDFGLLNNALGYLTSSVQLGFITGTLLFAIYSITDRFSPSKVFFTCAILGAVFNLAIIWEGHHFYSLLILRFLTGFCLAGIYPVGMKIAADYFDKGLGKSLGFLVGALVLGTALPHLLKFLSIGYSWQAVFITTSLFAMIGGLLILLMVPDGPYRKRGVSTDLLACFKVFKIKPFQQAAIGYFGHMWELYAFWAFVPVILSIYLGLHQKVHFDISLLSFLIIAIGSFACALGGVFSERFGVKATASTFLFASFFCCLCSPLILIYAPPEVFILFLLVWGMVVIADSPLFSTLVAQNAEPKVKGAALTIVNSIGFAITIVSIQLLSYAQKLMPDQYIFLILALGPAVGLIFLKKRI
ncbi:MAG: MFS transporter [Cyclobacteriaceae bacterium]